MPRTTDIAHQFGRLMVAIAALFLAFGPSLDAAAKTNPAQGSLAPFTEALRAFDVIDDAFDHLGSQSSGQQHQLQLPHALPAAHTLSADPRRETDAWLMADQKTWRSQIPERQTPPPRA